MSFFWSLFSQQPISPIDLSAESSGYTPTVDHLYSEVCGKQITTCRYICSVLMGSIKPRRYRFPVSQNEETESPVQTSRVKTEPTTAKMYVIFSLYQNCY